MTIPQRFEYDSHARQTSSRAPCPGLNTLANHGYISRTGVNIAFVDLIIAIHNVYNISYPLAFLLAFGGFVTSGRFSFRGSARSTEAFHDVWYSRLLLSVISVLTYFWTLDLASLSARGSFKITHDAALVHRDTIPSTTPDHQMLQDFMKYATEISSCNGYGLSLRDIAHYRARREQRSGPLDYIHKQIATGECGLVWLMLRGSIPFNTSAVYTEPAVPPERLQQWLSEERLPDGWWNEGGIRPSQIVGLQRARHVAGVVEYFTKRSIAVL